MKLAEDFSVSFDAKGHDPPRRRPVKRKNQRGTALPAGGAEMFPGAVRLPASAGTLGEGIRPTDAGGSMESAVCGGSAKETVYGVSAGYSAVRQYGGTGLRGR